MPNKKVNKVIIDTNIWISFLIGKQLEFLKNLIASKQIIIVVSMQLIQEIELVTQRPHLQNYFPKEKIGELIALLNVISQKIEPDKNFHFCRDAKDDFLLGMAQKSKADYLITGDKDLLILKKFGKTEIISPKEFELKTKYLL